MAKVTLTWRGDAEAQRALAGLPELIEKRVLASALRKLARQLLPAIVAATPVRQVTIRQRRTQAGRLLRISRRQQRTAARVALRFARLRNAYKIRSFKRSRRRVGVGIFTGSRQELGITGKGFYPAHIEYGFRTRGTRNQVRPRHYMKNPAMRQRGVLLASLATEIRAGVEREVKP